MERRRIGNKVFIETSSGRKYSGVIIDESETHIIIKDIKGLRVEIPKATAVIEEEEK